MIKKIAFALAFASSPAVWADADHPACAGTEIAPELRGAYEATGRDGEIGNVELLKSSMKVEFKQDGVTVSSEFPAWTCTRDGVEALVLKFVDAEQKGTVSYESTIILRSGDHLINLGEIYEQKDNLSALLVAMLNQNAPDFSVFKRKR